MGWPLSSPIGRGAQFATLISTRNVLVAGGISLVSHELLPSSAELLIP
jgi:hypothetical protein